MTSRSKSGTGGDTALRDALEREAATREILQVISRSRDDEKPVFDVILDNASRLCDVPNAGLYLVDDARTQIELTASRGARSAYLDTGLTVWPIDSTASISRAVMENRVIHAEDLADTDAYRDGDPLRTAAVDIEGMRTYLAVPLISGGQAIGCIGLFRRHVEAFTCDQIELLRTFAAQAVIAIENVRQFRELQTRLEREAATRSILQVISQSRADETPVFDVILESACQLCEAPMGMFYLRNDDRKCVDVRAQRGSRPGFLEMYQEMPLPLDPTQAETVRAMLDMRVIQIEDLAAGDLYQERQPHRVHSVEHEGIRTYLFIPLVSAGEGIGGIGLYRREVRPFDQSHIDLVRTFAEQAVIAIENVRQFRELQTRLEREAATREILQIISRSRDDEGPVFDFILATAQRLCGATMAAFVLGHEGGGPQIMVANHGATEETLELYRAGRFPMDPAISTAARAIIEKRTIHLEDMADTEGYRSGNPNFVALVDHQGIRTNLLVPVISQGEGIGCLILHRYEVRPYTADQIALVETFAAQAAIAIENVRQFRELQTRLEREAATREILQVIAQNRADETPVFDAILESASRLCAAPFAYLSMANEERTHVTVPAHLGARSDFAADLARLRVPIEGSKLALARAINERMVIRMDDIADDEVYRNRDPNRVAMVEKEGARSILVVPMISDGHGIGAIILYRREVAPFSDDDVALAESFAAQATIAVENVKQFKALQARTDEVQALNASLENRVATQVGELERLGRLKRFLSPQVADAVVSSGDEKLLGSHRALIAVLFCDIRGFTAFCETAEPEETIEVLQTYHEEMGQLINAHGAGVDHRAGDGIMVIFNDPLPCDDPAGDALRMAMAMRDRMTELCKGWRRLGHRLGFGVGISLGYATVGMVGSEGRYDYTASGTAVNLAARLCDEAADGEILLSPRAYAALEEDFTAESKGEISLKGISAPVEIFRVTAPGAPG